MLGYWERPDESAKALAGGELHTGDVGFLDDDGYLHLRDRKSLVIIRGGANVYPAEVERVLLEAPGVVASAVFGVPDERLGERVVAVVEAETMDEDARPRPLRGQPRQVQGPRALRAGRPAAPERDGQDHPDRAAASSFETAPGGEPPAMPHSGEWGQMAYVSQRSALHNEAMATKRSAQKAESAEMVDIAARLAPFFPPRVAYILDQGDGGAQQNVA